MAMRPSPFSQRTPPAKSEIKGQMRNNPSMILANSMAKTRIVMTLDCRTLKDLDRWVLDSHFASGSQAILPALTRMLGPRKRRRLADELGKLDSRKEQSFAEEFFVGEPP
jgi:hypothetical protein